MSSAVSSVAPPQHTPPANVQPAGRDSDGDNDGSKAKEIEKTSKSKPKPVSATIGNNINTTA